MPRKNQQTPVNQPVETAETTPKTKRTRKPVAQPVEQTVSQNTADLIQEIPVNLIRAGDNDRKFFDENKLRDLATNIQKNGLAQPITIRPMDGGAWYEIVAGERRFRAVSQILQLPTIRAIVRDLSDEEASTIMLLENLARENLDPIAEAKGLDVRMKKFGWTEEQAAQAAGMSVERVRNRVALLVLPDDIQHFVKIGSFPLGHAACILDLDKDRQRIAVRAFNSAKSMPLSRFQELVAGLREDMLAENQMSLFDLEAMVISAVEDSNQFALRGKKARTGAPVRKDLPKVKLGATDSVGDIFDRYVRDLQA
ncbi:MAG: ParB/RepB/Spo0J family partition protein, partial [Anaerolineae bacterium]|nr:ParB/RepB/Spo0J family partition protein [Anaerolineae bacterium]